MIDELFFSDFYCDICKSYTDKFLLHTTCKHKMCEDCKHKMFKSIGDQLTINCPFCRTPLKKKDISEKSQEEKNFEDETIKRIELKRYE
jgi:hypothetical protein